MRTLVLGASGYIGRTLFEALKNKYGNEVIGTSKTQSKDFVQLDIRDRNAAKRVTNFLSDPKDFVIILCGISKPELCKLHYEIAYNVNVDSTKKMICNILEKGHRVLFFSSDTVYGESKECFRDEDALAPLGVYASMKSLIEKEFLGHINFKSIRVSYVYSSTDSFTSYLKESAMRNVVAEVYHPFSRAMIFRKDLIEGTISLIDKWDQVEKRSINFGGPEIVSRIQYVVALSETFLPNLKYVAIPPSVEFLSQRPQVIQMKSDYLNVLLGRNPTSIRQTLISADFAKEWGVLS